MTQELGYVNDNEEDDDNRKDVLKPDVTIGLCTYNLNMYPWIQVPTLVDNDRIKLFDRKLLRDLRDHFEIPPHYQLTQNRAKDSFPQFPFALWEGKKASAPHNNQTALNQTAR